MLRRGSEKRKLKPLARKTRGRKKSELWSKKKRGGGV